MRVPVPKFLRRSSTISATTPTTSPNPTLGKPLSVGKRNTSKASLSLPISRERDVKQPAALEEEVSEIAVSGRESPLLPDSTRSPTLQTETNITENLQSTTNTSLATPISIAKKANPVLTVQEPTPEITGAEGTKVVAEVADSQRAEDYGGEEADGPHRNASTGSNKPHRPDLPLRRQSLVSKTQTQLIKTLLRPENRSIPTTDSIDYFAGPSTLDIRPNMLHRKIWVKRPGSSATLVLINEDDLVDDVRDMILRKYANSLGRSFDAPDITLRIVAREYPSRPMNAERTLGPEESITRTLDAYFPGGQTVEEALIIDVSQRRTPRPSPRPNHPVSYYYPEDIRPGESGTEYFPPMPAAPSPHLPPGSISLASNQVVGHYPSLHAIADSNTCQIPPLPSPGGRGPRHSNRPKYGRQHTSSPTIVSSLPSIASNGMAQIPVRSHLD